MAGICEIEDGKSYPHFELMPRFKFSTERAMKNFIADNHLQYFVVNGVWFVAGEDVRQMMRSAAKTHAQRQDEKTEGEN